MWTGSVVSPKWWNDAWFSESLPIFLAYLGLAKISETCPNLVPQKNEGVWEVFNFEREMAQMQDFLKDLKPLNGGFDNVTEFGHFLDQLY